MRQIEIDFEVFKALTALRETESVTYNDVIRGLLGLEKSLSRQMAANSGAGLVTALANGMGDNPQGFSSRGLSLPEATLLRTTY